MSIHETPDGRWYCAYREPGTGKLRKHYTGRGDQGRVDAARFDERVKLGKGKAQRLHEVLLVSDVCTQYHDAHHVQDTTARNDFYKFKILVRELGTIPAETLSTTHLNAFVHGQLSLGKKKTSISNMLGRLRAAYNWACRQEPPILVRNPLQNFHIPGAQKEQPDVPLPPTRTEIQKILAHAEPHLRRAVILQWFTGMRPGPQEMFAIRWRDVDWENRAIRVQSARKGGPSVRHVPIAASLWKDLMRWAENDRVNFGDRMPDVCVVHYRGECVLSVKRAWAMAKKRAGVARKLRLYDIRHKAITDMIRRGCPIKVVSEIGGHSRPDTTMRHYQHVTSEDHANAVDRIEDIVREME